MNVPVEALDRTHLGVVVRKEAAGKERRKDEIDGRVEDACGEHFVDVQWQRSQREVRRVWLDKG